MRIRCSLTLHDVEHCGYYPETGEPFCSVGEAMSDLRTWATSRDFVETQTHDPFDGLHPTYFADAAEHKGHWLLILWNEVPADEQSVRSVLMTSRPGKLQIIQNSIAANSVPGYATAYWFLPSDEMVTVRFKDRTANRKALDLYLTNFLQSCSPKTVIAEDPETADMKIVGYARSPGAPTEVAQAGFKTALVRNRGSLNEIVANVKLISRVIRKQGLNIHKPDRRRIWQQALARMNVAEPHAKRTKIQIRHEIGAGIEMQELERLIDEWQKSPYRDEDDYGFKIKGQIHWLSHSLVREEVSLESPVPSDEVPDAAILLSQLVDRFATLMRRS